MRILLASLALLILSPTAAANSPAWPALQSLPFGWPMLQQPGAQPFGWPVPQPMPQAMQPAQPDPRMALLSGLANPQAIETLMRLAPLLANQPVVDGMLKLAAVAANPHTAEGFLNLAAALAEPQTMETLSRLIGAMSNPRLGEALTTLSDPKVLAAVVTLTSVLAGAVAPAR